MTAAKKIIAYGNGGQTQDRDRTNVLHVECWPKFAGRGPHILSLDSVYYEGAETKQLLGRHCAHCGKGFNPNASVKQAFPGGRW